MVHWYNLTTDIKSYEYIVSSIMQTQFKSNFQQIVAFQT